MGPMQSFPSPRTYLQETITAEGKLVFNIRPNSSSGANTNPPRCQLRYSTGFCAEALPETEASPPARVDLWQMKKVPLLDRLSAFHQEFGPDGRLYFSNNSGNPIPGRPVYDDWETIYVLEEGAWYGWPDYYSSVPITDQRFRRPQDPQFKEKKMPMEVISHKFALTEETRQRLLKGAQTPPEPLDRITPHAAAQGFVFAPKGWGFDENDILLAEYGAVIPYEVAKSKLDGFQVSRVNLKTGKREPFMWNKSGKPASAAPGQPAPQGQGLERPLRVEVGPDGALYVVDFGVFDVSPKPKDKPTKMSFADSGVIWKVTRTQQQPQGFY